MKQLWMLSLAIVLIAGCQTQEQERNSRQSSGNEAPGDINQPPPAPPVPNKDIASKETVTHTYRNYTNERFGFSVDYPKDLLIPQGESGSGDGQAFQTKDGKAKLLVYRDFRDNMDPDKPYTIQMAYAEDTHEKGEAHPTRTVTYKHLGKNSYIVSGYEKGQIFYQKTLLNSEGLQTCILTFDKDQKAVYDQVCEMIYDSFH